MGSGGNGDEKPITPQERQLAKEAAVDHNQQVKVFRPIEKRYLAEAETTDAEKREVAGSVSADAALTGQKAKHSLFRNPNAQQSITDLFKSTSKSGVTRGEGESTAVTAAENNELRAKLKLASFGRGLQSRERTSLRIGARDAANRQNQLALIDQETRAARAEALGSVAGTTGNAFRRDQEKKEYADLYKDSGPFGSRD